MAANATFPYENTLEGCLRLTGYTKLAPHKSKRHASLVGSTFVRLPVSWHRLLGTA